MRIGILSRLLEIGGREVANTKYHDGEHYNMNILLGEMMKGLTQLILNMYRPIICSSTSLTCISYVVHE